MKKIHFLIILGVFLTNVSNAHSNALLIRNTVEMNGPAIQKQVKSQSWNRKFEGLRVRDNVAESLINSNLNEIVGDTASDSIRTSVDVKASYAKGERAFFSYIADEFRYPQRCMENGIPGSVILRFVVDEYGNISQIQAVEETKNCPEFTTEGIRVLMKSPKWVPAQKNGVNVKSWREIPIKFSIN